MVSMSGAINMRRIKGKHDICKFSSHTTHTHAHTNGSKVKLALLSTPSGEELLPGQEGVRV